MAYTDGELRTFIRDVVREAKRTSNIDTGFLRRSIKGDIIGRNKSVEFRQIFYGAYNDNSQLIEIAERIMPRDVQWKVIFLDEQGSETEIQGKTRTGRTIVRKQITSDAFGTSKIKQLLRSIGIGKKKIDGTKSD
jgi:DNA polymerase III delta prime subunit